MLYIVAFKWVYGAYCSNVSEPVIVVRKIVRTVLNGSTLVRCWLEKKTTYLTLHSAVRTNSKFVRAATYPTLVGREQQLIIYKCDMFA